MIEEENEEMAKFQTYQEMLYLLPSDIECTEKTLVLHSLPPDSQILIQKQNQAQSGPIYDIRVSSGSGRIQSSFLKSGSTME